MTVEVLTAREQEVAALLERGLSNKTIARQLMIGEGTVKQHVRSILTKLKTDRRTLMIDTMCAMCPHKARHDAYVKLLRSKLGAKQHDET